MPIVDINDISALGASKALIVFAHDADLDLAERRLLEVWGITTRIPRCVLPEPLADTIRRFASGDADAVVRATAAFRRLLADDSEA